MTRLRILHLITGLNTGGAEMALAHLLSEMDRAEFDSRVVCLIPPGPVAELIRSSGIPVDSLEMPPGRATLKGLLRLLDILRSYRPHILQTWLYHADLLGLLAGKLAGVPAIVWNIRSSWMNFSNYNRLSGLVLKLCTRLSGLPAAVVVNSQAGLTQHKEMGYHPRSWALIPNGVDTAIFAPNAEAGCQFRTEWQLSPQAVVIGLVGRLDPQKNHPLFLRAAQLVLQEIPTARFVCVGSGSDAYLATLKTQAQELSLGDRVLWTGTRKDIPSVYNALDLLVLSSAYGEGFPNVVAEAMACGKVCVVTEVGDSAALIADAGLSVPVGSPERLAQAILQMLKLPETERARLGAKARQRIVENFDLEKMTRAYGDLYRRLAQSVHQE